MKKYFFIVSLASFLFSSAQEKNHLDIQKFLQKQRENQQPIGKIFFDKSKKPISIYLPPQNPPQAKLTQVLPNGNKVYALPQDNMPCVEPNMKLYSDNMLQSPKKPELFNKQPLNKKQLPGAIPNPAYPWKIIPEYLK